MWPSMPVMVSAATIAFTNLHLKRLSERVWLEDTRTLESVISSAPKTAEPIVVPESPTLRDPFGTLSLDSNAVPSTVN